MNIKVDTQNEDIKHGVKIVQKALTAPIIKILDNAGLDTFDIITKIKEKKDTNYGFDARKEEFCDMVKSGVVDPVKVVRMAIQNASSVAGLIITTEATIFDEQKKECECSAGAGMGGGMPMM